MEMEPRSGSGAMGDKLQQEFLAEAEHDRLVHEAEKIHQEEAAERGEAPAKRPWWKFWA